MWCYGWLRFVALCRFHICFVKCHILIQIFSNLVIFRSCRVKPATLLFNHVSDDQLHVRLIRLPRSRFTFQKLEPQNAQEKLVHDHYIFRNQFSFRRRTSSRRQAQSANHCKNLTISFTFSPAG